MTTMKWTYSIQNKLTAAAVLFILCLVILYANYNDRMHTSKVIGLISTLYQDRITGGGPGGGEGGVGGVGCSGTGAAAKGGANASLMNARKSPSMNWIMSLSMNMTVENSKSSPFNHLNL